MSLFRIESLFSGYAEHPVLKGISLSINKKDFVGIIGPNGTGKSTLVKSFTGILKPFSGEINFLGKPLVGYEKLELARNMAVVPQFIENLIPFRVKDFVETGRFPFRNFWQKTDEKEEGIVREALEATGTLHLAERLLTELSGGELQLVSIARALAQSKEVIILDEPISSLDFRHAVRIMDTLHTLNRAGATIITVLHNINIASDYCSRIIGIGNGKIFVDGSPEECITTQGISELFDINCSVKKNPVTGKPYVYTSPGYAE
ncbi:MAG: ABC transporter ATP-binding protein [bacterium]|nr:ABC transporter ATP-binding protein [bacterium]